MKKIFLFLQLVLVFTSSIYPQLKFNYDGREYSIPSVNKKGVEYAACGELENIFNLKVHYNSFNRKIELKSDNFIVKFTAASRFVVIISRMDFGKTVKQIPLPAFPGNNDILIPFSFCKDIFESVLNKKIIVYTGKLPEIPAYSAEDENPKVSSEEKKDPAHDKVKYDIESLSFDVKTNGTLIKISSIKRINKYNYSVTNNILSLSLTDIKINPEILRLIEPKGLVKKIDLKEAGNISKLQFYLSEGYSNTEVFKENNNTVMITIHNKLLSNYDKIKERWSFDAIVIDAGHGGKDPGAIGVNGIKEKDINLAVALKVGKLIEDEMKGVKVIYTRSTDKFVELYRRGKIANENNGKLFISIHCNSTPKKPTDRNGFEVYLLRPGRTKEAISIAERENSVIHYEDNPDRYKELTDENFILVTMAHSSYMRYSEKFSELLSKKFYKHSALKSNGVKQAGFYVLVGASMPGVLIETGFLSNKEDAAYLSSKNGQESIANAVLDAVKDFKEEYNN